MKLSEINISRMKIIYLFLIILFSFSSTVFAQAPVKVKNGEYKVPYILEGNDTIPVVNLPLINIDEVGNPEYLNNVQAYYRLRFNVLKVYPYARLAAVKLNEMNAKMNVMTTERDRRRYKREVEEQVRRDFEEQIKKLDGSDLVILAEEVAFLILKREWQKVWFRNKY